MNRNRTLLPILAVMLLLGLLCGFALTGEGRADEGTNVSTPVTTTVSGTTTDSGTTTTNPADTTTGTTTTSQTTTTTDPPTTTNASDPATTTTDSAPPPTTTNTSTVDNGTGASNTGTGTQATQQDNGGSNGTAGGGGTPVNPVQCGQTLVATCGNNAANNIAVVSQNCVADGGGVVAVSVTTIDGTPVNNVTINNNTSCNNVLALTQIIQQFCVNCTIVIVPPPPAPRAAPAYAMYCTPQPVKRADGTWGNNVWIEVGQQMSDERYAGAVHAIYTPGVGYSCPVGYGGTPPPLPPVFTLTVPASFIGQWINLCIQNADPTKSPTCHSIKIDNGATVAIPVTQNVAATVTPTRMDGGKPKKPPKAAKPKSKKAIHAASMGYGATVGGNPKSALAKPKAHTTIKGK